MITKERTKRTTMKSRLLMILLTIASCVCLLFAFTACGGSGGDDAKKAEKVNEEEVYKEVFAALGQCYLTGEENELISDEEIDVFADETSLFYAMEDFDGNGIKELIAGYGYDDTRYFVSIYSIKDNHPVLLPTGYIYGINSEGVMHVSGVGEKTKEGSYKINGAELKKAGDSSEESGEMVFEWNPIPFYQLYAKAFTEGIDLNSAKEHTEIFSSVWIKRGDRFLPLIYAGKTPALNRMNYLQNPNDEETYENLYWIWTGAEEYEQTLGENDELVEIVEGTDGDRDFVKMEGSQGYTFYDSTDDNDVVEYRYGFPFNIGSTSTGTIHSAAIEEINGEPLDTSEIDEYMESLIENNREKSEKAILSNIVSDKGTVYSPNKYFKLCGASIYLGSDDKENFLGFHLEDDPSIDLYYIIDMQKGETVNLTFREEGSADVYEGSVTANVKYLNFPDDITNYKPERTELKYKKEKGYLVIDTSMLDSGEYVIDDDRVFKK